jgi:predicted 3-demethylubiquinone-9 3-methyltransferase (glyoxalase superfamily)
VPQSVATFLMFEGAAEEALRLYVSLFQGSQIDRMERYGPGEAGAEGSVKRANFTLGGQRFIGIDSPAKHAFSFTPSISIFVECQTEAELDEAFAKLSEGGEVLMPPANYGFSTKFVWLNDRFGVSWQLNLP